MEREEIDICLSQENLHSTSRSVVFSRVPVLIQCLTTMFSILIHAVTFDPETLLEAIGVTWECSLLTISKVITDDMNLMLITMNNFLASTHIHLSFILFWSWLKFFSLENQIMLGYSENLRYSGIFFSIIWYSECIYNKWIKNCLSVFNIGSLLSWKINNFLKMKKI